MSASLTANNPADFSMVLGGPLYRLFLRTRMSRPTLELLPRRIIVLSLIAWLPLLVLALIAGRAFGDGRIGFLDDVDAHVRFLVSLPLLIYAECLVHKRIRPIIAQFYEREIIPPEQRPQFEAILGSSIRLRDSVVIEAILIVLVLTIGHVLWRKQVALQTATWYADTAGGSLRLTLPGFYFAFVSLPLFQFILVRWYFRLFIWYRCLWRVAKLELRLFATHPDQVGGLGFLQDSAFAFMPVLIAHSVLLAGFIANRILHGGATLPMFKLEILGMALFLIALALVPLMAFAPPLAACRRKGLREYGRLASVYVRQFDHKWFREPAGEREPVLGTADVQSLADLGSSFDAVRQMQSMPFGRRAVISLAVTILLPVAPLVLTMVPLDELLKRLLTTLL